MRWGSVSGREEAPGRRVHDQDRLSDRELANPPTGSGIQRPDALYAIAATTMTNTASKFARLAVIARRGEQLDSGLGVYRWVVEQGFALLHWFRRLRIRWEIRDDIHEAFLRFACAIICWRRLHNISNC